jgi:hypothetical protein
VPAVSRFAWAQSYPDRPVRMVVPYAPAGPTDVITRLLAQKLSERAGKQFYVENMGGGGGNIARRSPACSRCCAAACGCGPRTSVGLVPADGVRTGVGHPDVRAVKYDAGGI